MKRIMSLLFLCAIVFVLGLGIFQANTAQAATVCSMYVCNYCNPPTTSGPPLYIPQVCYCDEIEWQATDCVTWCNTGGAVCQ